MGWFGFGSSEKPSAVNRDDRQRCWESRDSYFACLDAAGVLEAGKEGKACSSQVEKYEANCAKSWVCRWIHYHFCFLYDFSFSQIQYFNKRRVIQEQQKGLLAASNIQAQEAKKKAS